MYRDVRVKRSPHGLRQPALSISRLSPMESRPAAFFATKMASLILRPDGRVFDLTSFHRWTRPSLSSGSSSLISRLRQSFSLSRCRLRPPGNIQTRSRRRLTRRTRPCLVTTSFEDFAIFWVVSPFDRAARPKPMSISSCRTHSMVAAFLDELGSSAGSGVEIEPRVDAKCRAIVQEPATGTLCLGQYPVRLLQR